MESKQFCYWLMGSFELNGTVEFDESQTRIIKEHLELVFSNDKTPNGFCHFLNGYFALSNPKSLDAEKTILIKNALRNIFKSEIDPSYPRNEQHLLDEIHNGKMKGGTKGLEVLC